MAHSLSSLKRIRQNQTRRARNRARKSALKSQEKRLQEAMSQGDSQLVATELRATIKRIDQVAAKGTLHRNTAARRKSKIQRQVNAMKAPAPK